MNKTLELSSVFFLRTRLCFGIMMIVLEVVNISIRTSEKMEMILSRSGHTKKWLAEQWGVSQPSISQKFKENNWKESDIKKFCEIVGASYNAVFEYDGDRIE